MFPALILHKVSSKYFTLTFLFHAPFQTKLITLKNQKQSNKVKLSPSTLLLNNIVFLPSSEWVVDLYKAIHPLSVIFKVFACYIIMIHSVYPECNICLTPNNTFPSSLHFLMFFFLNIFWHFQDFCKGTYEMVKNYAGLSTTRFLTTTSVKTGVLQGS